MIFVRLNLGCNEWRLAGFVNIDCVTGPLIQPDVVADALRLPFRDGSVDEIYAGHILEHFALTEPALPEWHRVLRRGGRITVTTPDVERSLRALRAGDIDLDWFQKTVFGSGERRGQDHHAVFTTDILQTFMSRYFTHVERRDTSPYLVSAVSWQTIVTGVKQ